MIRARIVIGVSVSLLLLCILASAHSRGDQRPPDPRSRGGGDCRDNAYNCIDTPTWLS